MKQKGNILTILVILAFLIAGVVAYSKSKPASTSTPSNPQPITSTTEQKTFQSKNLKFTANIPTNSSVQEKNTYVDVFIDGILIDFVRNGTNFDSLKSYLDDYDTKKKVQITDSRSLTVNGYQAVSRIETNLGSGIKQKVYYIYIDNWVYTLSTTSESLFDDLDQIAQSFRYTP